MFLISHPYNQTAFRASSRSREFRKTIPSRFVSGSECRLHCATRSLSHLQWPSRSAGADIENAPRLSSLENPTNILREKRSMETNIKPKSASTNATQQVRGMTEKGA